MFDFFNLKTANAKKAQFVHSLETEAVVQEVVQQGKLWRVYYQATWWNARCNDNITLFVGDLVHVVDRHNITLIIEAAVAH